MNDDIRKAMAAILDWQTDCITMHFDTTEEEHAALEAILLRLVRDEGHLGTPPKPGKPRRSIGNY